MDPETQTALEPITTDRLTLVVWRWEDAKIYPLPQSADWDKWHSADGAIFLRATCSKSDESCVFLADLVKRHLAPEGNLLCLLHTSGAQYFDENSSRQLAKQLGLPASRYRIRLFGVGKGPVYVLNDDLGILAREGNLPTWYRPEGADGEKQSDFVLNGDQKIVNDKHLDHLWASYWNTPFAVLHRLWEDWHWHLLGFGAQRETPPWNLRKYLRLQPALWHKLARFAQREDLRFDNDLWEAAAECDARIHYLHLKTYDNNIAEQILEISWYIAKILDSTEDAIPDMDKIARIQSDLSGLTDKIPSNLL